MPEEQTRKNDVSEDPFKKVEDLLTELKSLRSDPEAKNNTNSTQSQPQLQPINEKANDNVNKLESEIKNLESELSKINDGMIILATGEIVDLSKIPRREWRNFRDSKSLLDVKQEELRNKKRQLQDLKKSSERPTISETKKTDERPQRERHHITIEMPKEETQRVRPSRQLREDKKENIDDIAETIYYEAKKNPVSELPDNTKTKTNDETASEEIEETQENNEQKESKKNNIENNEFGDLNLDLDSDEKNNESSDELNDMELDLNLDSDEKDKKKKKF